MQAQDWTWPERAENLKELPADFSAARLGAVMRGFSRALGVRCSHCHVGEEGQPLSTYDFVSDANPNKDRARAMYRMLGAINDHLGEIEPSGAAVNMWCHTCHAGRPRPQTLEEAVDERYEASGPDEAFAYYLELRRRYFGAAAYDFTPMSVDGLGTGFQARGDTAIAHRFFEHNLASSPSDWLAQEKMGDVWLARADTSRAIDLYRRAMEGRPDNPRAAAKLRSLGGG
jgi:tetratricopeptide (TPR) repeat protein